jgi:Matrixin.
LTRSLVSLKRSSFLTAAEAEHIRLYNFLSMAETISFFRFWRSSGEVYFITPKHAPNSFINVYNANTSYNTNIGIYRENSPSANAKWKLQRNRIDKRYFYTQFSGSYRLGAMHASGPDAVSMVVQGASTATGAAVQTYSYNQSYNDEWVVATSGCVAIALYEFDSVDDGKHLDVSFQSPTYNSLVYDAVWLWNNYKPGVIRQASITNLTDATVSEESITTDLETAAYTQQGQGICSIKLNKSCLRQSWITDDNRRKVIMHELGHALGLNHQWVGGRIMTQGLSSMISPADGDRASYDLAYSKY